MSVSERLCDIGGGITLCHETFGADDAPPLLLIMGLAGQMVWWPDEFCAALAERGFRVIRFDNRDSGRSTHLEGVRPPTLRQLVRSDPRTASYTLGDMAGDAAALLTALDAAPAHVVGISMGGMIAQLVAARRPELVRSLASLSSNTGSRFAGRPGPRMLALLLRRPPAKRDASIDYAVKLFAAIAGPAFPFDEAALRAVAERSLDRGVRPGASGRQLAAIVATGNRTAELRRITAPTVVVHGSADRLVPPSGGRATARAIPGARLVTIRGMGHDLPRGAWPRIADAIADNAARAGWRPARSPVYASSGT